MLEEIERFSESISVRIQQQRDFAYATRFVGRDGAVHNEAEGTEASYDIQGSEGYVRAVVTSSSGAKAWTQPVFLS